MKITILMTTFNRKDSTIRCLTSLAAAIRAARDLDVRIILADASSPDNTRAAVQKQFPDVHTLSVPSSCYWASGMRAAWKSAQETDFDILMWLNDDVVLETHSLQALAALSHELPRKSIIVGAFHEPDSANISYGGARLGPRFRRLSFKKVLPSTRPQPIDSANGNLVWIPRATDLIVGGFPAKYTHGMADNAYTLEARRRGIGVFLAPNTLGSCESNSICGTWRDKSLSARARLALIRSPKGLPFAQYWRFCVRYGGTTGLLYALKPYVSLQLLRLQEVARKKPVSG